MQDRNLEWGLVFFVAGEHKGRAAYYDNDEHDEGRNWAIVYLRGSGEELMVPHEHLRAPTPRELEEDEARERKKMLRRIKPTLAELHEVARRRDPEYVPVEPTCGKHGGVAHMRSQDGARGGNVVFKPGKGWRPDDAPASDLDGSFVFELADGTEAIRLGPDGFFVRGKLVDDDDARKLYTQFRAWFAGSHVHIAESAQVQ